MSSSTLPHNRAVVIGCGVFAVAFLVLFAVIPYTHSHQEFGHGLIPVTSALWFMWQVFPDFQHGMLVPLISLFLIYRKRGDLAALPIRGSLVGGALMILTFAIFWGGRRVDNQYIGFFSIQLFVATFVLWFFGWAWLRKLAFPIAFLSFAWPLPFLDNIVAFPLRMAMSQASVTVLNALGLNAIQNGTAIVSAANPEMMLAAGDRFAVDVADPCSGIRSLFALTMISALYAHFALRTPGRQLLLFLSSVPLAVLGNLFRILLLTFGIIILGPKVAIGTLEHPSLFHMVSGFAVFLVALGGMTAFGSLLKTSRRDVKMALSGLRNFRPTERRDPEAGISADVY